MSNVGLLLFQMAEMEIPKPLAEKALVAGNGDLKAAYEWLIYGPKKDE